MKKTILILLLLLAFDCPSIAQTTIEPTSLTLGIDQINMVDNDTILHWGKNRSAFRGGYFRSSDITNANTGQFSFAYGDSNKAQGESSVALGNFNNAIHESSIAIGTGNAADGISALALGFQNRALFSESYAIGTKNVVKSRNSVALGDNLIVNNVSTIALGTYNDTIEQTFDFDSRPLFMIGNGDPRDIGRSNAVTVMYNGFTGLKVTNPESDLHLVHDNGDHEHGFRIENKANGNWWRFYSRSAFNELELYNLTSGPQSAVGKFEASGNYVSLSDRRLKKKIIDLPYGLKDVLKLSPKRYQFKHIESHHDIGLIAQDVMNVIPELVNFDASKDRYMMNYDGFGVLSIKAIQELNEVVETQKETIDNQQELIENLIKRVEQLEKLN